MTVTRTATLGLFLVLGCFLGGGRGIASVLSSEDASSPPPERQPEAYQERLVEWLRADPRGFFHPAIRWRRLGPDGAGPYAYHVTQDVAQGTPLIVLPRRYVLESHEPEADEDDVEHYGEDPRMCTTVQRMVREYDKMTDGGGEEDGGDGDSGSFYAPYLSYLFGGVVGGTTPGLLPTAWSHAGRNLLDLILGDADAPLGSLPPDDVDYPHVYDVCPEHDFGREDGGGDGGNGDDASGRRRHAQDAYLFLLSRGWKDKLLPLVDFVNHRNGPQKNVEVTPLHDGPGGDADDVAVYALRDIGAGEQLQYSYTECLDATCDFGAFKYDEGTPEVLAEFGFVEAYPRRWSLYPALDEDAEDYYYIDDEEVIIAEITADEDASGVVLRWIERQPSAASLRWIERQLRRLRSVESTLRLGVAALRASAGDGHHSLEHEAEQLVAFHAAYLEVLELALRHRDDPVAVTLAAHEAEVSRLRRTEGQRTAQDLRNDYALLLSRSVQTATGSAVTDEL